jgi:hypothetical protein
MEPTDRGAARLTGQATPTRSALATLGAGGIEFASISRLSGRDLLYQTTCLLHPIPIVQLGRNTIYDVGANQGQYGDLLTYF